MFTQSEIEKNRSLEDVKAQIKSLATNLTRVLEEDTVDNFVVHNEDTLGNSISSLCPTFGFHLSMCYERIYRRYYKETVLPSLKIMHGKDLLKKLDQRMTNHKSMVSSLSEIFKGLNNFLAVETFKTFTPSEKMPDSLPLQVFSSRQRRGTKIRNLEDLAMATFRDELLLELNLESRAGVMHMITKEREGVAIDRDLLKSVLDIYIQCGIGTLDVYKEHFEIFFLKETVSYYSQKASSWIQQYSCLAYMIKYENALKKEKERVTRYLDSSTESKLVEIVQAQLLVSVLKQLLNKVDSGCLALLRDDKMGDLSRMYRHFCAIPQALVHVADVLKLHIADVLKLHIATEGGALIKQAEDSASGSVDDQELVGNIIDLHNKYTVYVTDCFEKNTLFDKALKDAFGIIFSKKVAGRPSAELLATFLDNLLKKGESVAAIESTIDKAVRLLDYTSDRDLFSEVYRKKLASSLLSGKSNDGLREIFSRLKTHFGQEFTVKMEAMVTDMGLSNKTQIRFKERIERHEIAKPEVDFSASVLDSSKWPSYKDSSKLNLPVEMAKCVEAFETIHKTIPSRAPKKLTWVHSLGKCTVLGTFDCGKEYDFHVSTYQAATLCAFNNSERLTYKEIREQVNLSDKDLVIVLDSLSCRKFNILKKEPPVGTISETDSFVVNSKFNKTRPKINVAFPTMDQETDQETEVIKEVVRDRTCAVEACLVRIMKKDKVLHFKQLVALCDTELAGKFKPDIKMIKNRIESLIKREYLETDAKDANIFRYLA